MRYHVHARLTEGVLGAFTRDEVQTRETDDLAEAQKAAFELACLGWTTWVYGHDHRPTGAPVFGESRSRYRRDDEPEWHSVAQDEPGGRRVR